jgi:AsmA protein
LIKRSTVTGPLLDALKDRNTRDAVRSVLERLTGTKQPDPDAAAPAASDDPPAK